MTLQTVPSRSLVRCLALATGVAVRVMAGTVGLDFTVEGSTALSGEKGHALHALALGHAEFGQLQPAEGASLTGYVSGLALMGHGPTERYVNDFLAVSNIEGEPGARLYSWWLEGSRQGWSMRAGALLADEEFAGTATGGNFCNSAFGWPAFISANTINTGPAFYAAALGIRVEKKFKGGACRVGCYDGDSFDSSEGDPAINRSGAHYQLGGDQGCFLISELEWNVAAGTQLKLGAWLHTARFANLRDDDDGAPFALSGRNPRLHSGNVGGYAALERSLSGEADQPGHVVAFVRAGIAPRDRNPVDWALDTGIAWTGPWPRRPTDVFALGLAHAHLSSRLAHTAQLLDPFSAPPDFEQVVEATYTVNLRENLDLQFDLQSVRHPGGTAARASTLIALVRLNASY